MPAGRGPGQIREEIVVVAIVNIPGFTAEAENQGICTRRTHVDMAGDEVITTHRYGHPGYDFVRRGEHFMIRIDLCVPVPAALGGELYRVERPVVTLDAVVEAGDVVP